MPTSPTSANKILILGGARSGKSRIAERILSQMPASRRLYVATAEAHDDEMRARIARHREDRAGRGFVTVEAPLALPEAIAMQSGPDSALLVDCLTLWLSNVMLAGWSVEHETTRFADAVVAAQGALILVSNEVGLGIVPDNALARAFRDAAGRLHQRLAARLPCVLFVAAGLPLVLKGTLPEMTDD